MEGWRGKEPHWLTVAADQGGEVADNARAFVLAAVRSADGSVNRAAKQIGMAQSTLDRAIRRLGIERAVERERHRAKLREIDSRGSVQKKTPPKNERLSVFEAATLQ